jgi:hypothetical protein
MGGTSHQRGASKTQKRTFERPFPLPNFGHLFT